MDSSNNRIRRGIKICKFIIIFGLIIGSLRFTNSYSNRNITEDFNFNKSLGLTAMADKNEEAKPEPVVNKVEQKEETTTNTKKVESTTTISNTIRGQLTGYIANCPACSGKLACKSNYNVSGNGVVTYPDSTYGTVRIVASSKNLPCGSIVKFKLSTVSSEDIYAIVLDRGVLGNDLDLLMATNNEALTKVGRRNISYEVLRTGW